MLRPPLLSSAYFQMSSRSECSLRLAFNSNDGKYGYNSMCYNNNYGGGDKTVTMTETKTETVHDTVTVTYTQTETDTKTKTDVEFKTYTDFVPTTRIWTSTEIIDKVSRLNSTRTGPHSHLVVRCRPRLSKRHSPQLRLRRMSTRQASQIRRRRPSQTSRPTR